MRVRIRVILYNVETRFFEKIRRFQHLPTFQGKTLEFTGFFPIWRKNECK